MDVNTHAFLHGTEAVALLLAINCQLKISRSFLPIRRKCDFTAHDCIGCARESLAGIFPELSAHCDEVHRRYGNVLAVLRLT